MEKGLLNEELIRIWEIMGINGNRKLINESYIDELMNLVITAASKGGPDLVQNSGKRIQNVIQEFPYFKGVDAGDISKIAKGGTEALPVLKKVISNLPAEELTKLADDITSKSPEIKNLVTDQFGGLSERIGKEMNKQDVLDYIDSNINNWVKSTDADVPQSLIDQIRKNVANDLKVKFNRYPDVGPFPYSSGVVDDVADDVSKLMDEIDDTTEDVILPKVESQLKTQIKNSDKFKDLKLPSNVDADDLADQVSKNVAAKIKKQVEMVDPKVWDALTPTKQLEYLETALSELKKVNPTSFEKIKKYVVDFFTTNPDKKLKWSRAKQLWIAGMIPVAAYQIKDVVDTVKDGGNAGDIGISVADGVLKTTLWPANLLTFGQIDLESDYLDSLKSFEKFTTDNGLTTPENAMDMTDKQGTSYYVMKLVGPPDNRKEEWVEYVYNSSLGNFVEKKGANTNTNQNPNTPTNCPGKSAFETAVKNAYGASYDSNKMNTFDDTKCIGTYDGETYTWNGSDWVN